MRPSSKLTLVNANNRIVPDDYPFLLSADWNDAYRARRIEALLDGARDLDDFSAIQQDRVSLMARELLPLLLAPAPARARAAEASAIEASAIEARAMLAAWDGAMDRDRPEPLIFAAWMRELNRAIYADELAELFPEVWAWRPRFVTWALTKGQVCARWRVAGGLGAGLGIDRSGRGLGLRLLHAVSERTSGVRRA